MNKRKKITILGTLLLGILCANSVFATTGTITTETVRVRKEPSTESKIVINGNLGEEVEILGKEGEWYKVNYNGKEGYIFEKYLEPDGEVANSQETQQSDESQVVQENPTVQEDNTPVVTTGNIGDVVNKETNGYLLPNFSSIKVSKIEKGKKVELITTVANWTKIEVDDSYAWVPNNSLMTEATMEPQQEPVQEPVEEEPVEQPVTEPEVPETTVKEINQAGYISSNASANMRSGPSTDTKSLRKLPRHTAVTVISEENDWYKVNYNGQEGYISKSLVTLGNAPEETTSSRNTEEPRNVSSTQQTSSTTGGVVSTAQNYLGYKYVSGGSSPATGFDCSGFTQYVYAQSGISLSRTAASQASNGTAIEKSDLQPGDLLLFHYYGNSSIGHVGIYVGNGQFIHAANSNRGVVYDTINSGYYAENYAGARRF